MPQIISNFRQIRRIPGYSINSIATADFGDGADSLGLAIDATQADGGPSVIELTPGHTYTLSEGIEKTLTKPLEIRGNGATISSAQNYPLVLIAHEYSNLTLTADVAYNSKTISVSNAAAVSVGDIIVLSSDVALSTVWITGYVAIDTRRVVAISGNTITLDSPTNLSYTTSTETVTVRHFKDVSVQLENFTINNTATSGITNCLRLWGLSGNVRDLTVKGSNGGTKDGIWLWGCVNMTIDRPRINNVHYGVSVYGSRFTNIYNVRAENVLGHPVTIGAAASHTLVDGLICQNCPAAVDSHPAFHVRYRNVEADGASFNLRAWGMTLENALFKNAPQTRVDTLLATQIPSATLTKNPHLLTDYDLVLRNVKYTPVQSEAIADYIQVQMNFRNVIIDECELNALFIEYQPVHKSQVTNSRLGYFWQRQFAGTAHACNIDLTNVVFDGALYLNSEDCMRIYTGSQKPVLTNVRCVNNGSGSLFGVTTFASLVCVNCDFGTWADFATSIVGTPAGYKFINCTMTITSDAYISADLTKFLNCTGSVAGVTLRPLNTPNLTVPAFSNADEQATSTLIIHSAVTVTGDSNAVWPVMVRGDGSPELQINSQAWATEGTIRVGDTVKLRLTSSGSNSTESIATLYYPEGSRAWSVTTEA